MANEFVARNGIIAKDNSTITGTLAVSGNITMGGLLVATQSWVTTRGYATESYVTTAINDLIGSAPGALNTLNELAAALGDDPNFATTVTNSIATKVPQTRTLTINGTAFDLSADRSWTISSADGYISDVRLVETTLTFEGEGNAFAGDIDLSTLPFAPQGSYLTAEADTLATVTGRGNSTTNSITVGGFRLNNTGVISYSGYAGLEYHNTYGTWEGYIGTETGTGNLRYNSRLGIHNWYSNSVFKMSLNSYGLGIGRNSASNEKLAIDLSDGIWGVHIYSSGTAIGGLHANSNVITLQSDSNRNIELATGTGNANWNGNTLATRTWVAAQGYLTSETDSQELEWNQAEKLLTISNGNTVDLSQMASVSDIEDAGFITAEADTLATVTGRGASTSTAVTFNGGATISGTGGDGSEVLRLTGSASDAFNYSTASVWGNLTAGETVAHVIGKAESQYNTANFGYRHVADGSSSNHITIGMFQADNLLNILGNGNVGIGTTSPAYKLQVDGTGYFGGDLNVNANINLTANNSYININRETTNSDGLLIYKTGGSNRWLLGAWGNSNNTFYLYSYGVGGSVVAVDYSTGNVGIGTTAPGRGLTINRSNEFAALNIIKSNTTNQIVYLGTDTSGADDGGILQLYDGAVEKARVYTRGDSFFNGGNVGIGTTSPLSALDVRGNISLDRDRYIFFGGNIGTTGEYIYEKVPGTIAIHSGGSDAIVFPNNSTFIYTPLNIGIGTDNPQHGLHVSKNQNQVAAFESPNPNTWIDLISTAGTWSMGATSSNTWAIYQRGAVNALEFEVSESAAFISGEKVATQDWVTSQGYLTSETDSQTLDWNQGEKTLTISNGNTVTLDGLVTEEFVTSQGYITSLPSHNHDDRYYTESESDSRFVNVSGDTMNGSLSFDAAAVIKKKITGVGDNPVKTASGVLASRSDNSSGYVYYVIETTVPQDNYQMGGFTIELFGRYGETNNKTKIDLGGYWNPEPNGGFVGFEAHGTNPQYKPTIEVARNSAGNTAFIIYGVSWSYPVIVARDLWLGYNSTDPGTYGEGWTIAGTNDVSSYTNKDTVIWRNAYSDSNPAGYITGYTETDTLASVTGRGSSTTSSITVNGSLLALNNGVTNAYTTASNGRLYLGSSAQNDYSIYTHMEDFNGNYTKLTLDWHTGIKIGASTLYGGIRFYSDAINNGGVKLFSVGEGDAHVRVENNLYVGNTIYNNGNAVIHAGNIGSQSVSYATSAGSVASATNLSGLGSIQSTSTGTSYTANYQVRENAGGGGNTNEIYAPQLAFHWSGVVASSIMMEASGRIAIRNNPGGSYENFAAAVITATGGNSTNWNTAYGWGNHADASYIKADSLEPLIIQAEEVIFTGSVTVEGTITESSSIRFKENIVDLELATEKVEQLRPVRYNKIGVEEEEIGLIAEEVAEIYPEVVTYNEEGEPTGVNYTRLSVILLKSVQELAERINKLENK